MLQYSVLLPSLRKSGLNPNIRKESVENVIISSITWTINVSIVGRGNKHLSAYHAVDVYMLYSLDLHLNLVKELSYSFIHEAWISHFLAVYYCKSHITSLKCKFILVWVCKRLCFSLSQSILTFLMHWSKVPRGRATQRSPSCAHPAWMWLVPITYPCEPLGDILHRYWFQHMEWL